MNKKKIVIVGGPTASGKTSIGIELSKKFNGEIINCDSRQFYKGLDIGTAKEKTSEKIDDVSIIGDIPHHLIDFLEPDESFDLAAFQKLAFETIENIHERSKLPILVGGTGLYIDAVVFNYSLNNELINKSKRNKLSKLSVESLQEKLKEVSGEVFMNMNNSDQNNPHRLIRAIEKAGKTHKNEEPKYDYLYLLVNPQDQKKKITSRVEKMFKEGLEEENRKLRSKGYSTKNNSMKSIGYQEFNNYFENKQSLEEIKELIITHTRQYAKRQITWFKRNDKGKWINDYNDALRLVSIFTQSSK